MPCSFAKVGISSVISGSSWTRLPEILCDEITFQWFNGLNIAMSDNPGSDVFVFGSTNLGSFTMPSGGNAQNIWIKTNSAGVAIVFIWKLG